MLWLMRVIIIIRRMRNNKMLNKKATGEEGMRFLMKNIVFIILFLVIAAILIYLFYPRISPSATNKTLYNFAVGILTARGGS